MRPHRPAFIHWFATRTQRRSASNARFALLAAALLACSEGVPTGGGEAEPLGTAGAASGAVGGGASMFGGQSTTAGEGLGGSGGASAGGGGGASGGGDPTAGGGPEWSPPEAASRWSDPATWGGQVPAPGEAVVIAPGQSVLLDVDAAPSSLQINGSLFCDNADLRLSADSIMVHGRLQCGAASAPFRHRLEITLTGSDPELDVMGMGTKLIGAMGGGVIELYGESRMAWTRLDRTAAAGSSTLRVTGAEAFRSGDRVVIASTDFDMNQAEQREIVAVSSASAELTLDQPLQFLHFGETQTYENAARSWRLDERAEVALLNRNIVIQGDESSTASGFGGHLMMMPGTTLKLSNVELTRMGQRGKLARYPIHWHLAGNAAGQFVESSSIHHTFNRCITVHGTQQVRLEGNVCYDNVGHAFFLEDGVEKGNVIRGNLGLVTRRPAAEHALLRSDRANRGSDPLGPATFWISHPDNVITGNVAAGSDGSGFWYGVHDEPTGPSAGAPEQPSRAKLGTFDGNVIHSVAGMAMVLGAADMDGPGSLYNPTEKAVFTGSSYYKTRARGIWAHGSGMRFENWVIADNVRGAFFSFRSELADSLIVGESANVGTPSTDLEKELGRSLADSRGTVAGYVLYDGPVLFEDVHFAGFDRDGSGVYVFANNGAALHQMNNVFRRITFAPDTRRIYPEAATFRADNGQRHAAIVDEDGSISGRPGSYLLPSLPLNVNERCVPGPWSSKLWSSCMNRYGVIRLRPDFGSGYGKGLIELTVARSDGPSAPLNDVNKNWYQVGAIVSADYRYRFAFPTGKFPRVAQLSLQGVPATDVVVIELYPAPAGVTVRSAGTVVPTAKSLPDLSGGAAPRMLRQGDSLFVKLGSATLEVR